MNLTFRIDPRGSVRLAAVLLLLHLAAALSALVAMAGLSLGLVLAGIVLSGFTSTIAAVRPLKYGVYALGWDAEDGIWWLGTSGRWSKVDRFQPLYVSVWLTIVWLQAAEWRGRRGRLILLGPDSGEPEQLRQLRVRLRNAGPNP